MPFAAVFIFGHAGIAGVFLMIAVMYTSLAASARFAPETLGQPLEVINEMAETDPEPATVPGTAIA